MGKFKAKVAATRYRNPSRALRIIAVAGPYGKTTTALLLGEILQEAGHSVLTLTNQSCQLNDTILAESLVPKAAAIQRLFALARKKKADFVIVEVDKAILATQVLDTVTLEMSILTGDSDEATALSEHAVAYTVVPSSRTTEGIDVVPHQAISFGDDELADARVKDVKLYKKGTEIELVIDHNTTLQLATHLIGRANAYNVAAAVAAAYVLSVSIDSFEEGAARLEYVPSNYEYLPVNRVYDLVLDGAYQQKSLELVIADARKLTKRRLLVVADGSVSAKYYSTIKHSCDSLTAVGATDSPGIKGASSPADAAEVVLRGAKQQDTVLFIGRDFARLESEHLSYAQRLVEGLSE